MIEFMEESEGDVLGVRARGTLTSYDYRQVLVPRLEALVRLIAGEVRAFPVDRLQDAWKWLCT